MCSRLPEHFKLFQLRYIGALCTAAPGSRRWCRRTLTPFSLFYKVTVNPSSQAHLEDSGSQVLEVLMY